MSENICLAPRISPPAENLICELPEQDTANPIPIFEARGKASSLIQSSPRPLARHLSYYQALIHRGAFGGFSTRPRNTGYGALEDLATGSLLLTACSFNTSGPPFDDDSGAQPISDSGIIDAAQTTPDARMTPDAGETCEAPPQPQLAPMADPVHDTVPCGDGAIITDLDDGVGVCAKYSTGPEDPPNHQLFSWDPATAGGAMTMNLLAFAPDQVLTTLSGEYFITTHGNSLAIPPQLPGMAIVNASLPDPVQYEPFPAIVLATDTATSTGRMVTMVNPGFPKGLAEYGDQVFVATSNLDLSYNDFQPGTVLAYNRTTENWTPIMTTGFNPTSVAVHNSRLYVVNTGAVDFDGIVTTESSIDVFNPVTHTLLKNIPLGLVAAGISGEIRFSADGNQIFLPTGDNSGRIITVDLLTDTPHEISLPVTGDKVLLSGLALLMDDTCPPAAYVANYNDGMVYTLRLDTEETLGSLQVDDNLTDFLGLSDGILKGRELFLGMGNQILKLPLE